MNGINFARTAILPKGNYRVRVEKTELSAQPGASGYHYINLTYQVLTSGGKPTGRNVFDRLSLSPKARFMLEAFLDAIDSPQEGGMSIPKFLNWLRGKTLWVAMDRTEHQGKIRNEVTGYLTASVVESMSEEDLTAGDYVEPEGSFDDDGEDYSSPKSFNPLEDEEEDSPHAAVASVPDELANSEDIPY